MSTKDNELNQSLSGAKSPFSPAHQHLQHDAPDAITANKSEQEKIDRLAMESARRASNRFAKDDERIPTETLFTK